MERKLDVQPNEKCSSTILMFKDLRTCWDNNTCKCMMGFFFSFHQNNTLPIRVLLSLGQCWAGISILIYQLNQGKCKFSKQNQLGKDKYGFNFFKLGEGK